MSNLTNFNLDNLESIKRDFIELTDKETFTREANFAVQIFQKNKMLQKCEAESTLEAIKNVACTGLTLNPTLKLAYLIPRYDSYKKKYLTTLEPSYQGLVKLVTDTGSAVNVYSYIVYEGDDFQETLGTSMDIIHVPKRQSDKPILVYAVAVLADGSKQVEVMTRDEIVKIMEMSESYKAYKAGKIKSCIWVQHWKEMWRKTVIKRLVKYLPKTERWDKLATAIESSNMDYRASLAQMNMIENLLMTANIEPERENAIYQEVNTSISSDRAQELIEFLQENQADPIKSGSYSQTDLKDASWTK